MLLQGRIRTLSQKDADDWLRREIIVAKDLKRGSPKVGDSWILIDLDGNKYSLTFIKGANVRGYTCLGQPGKLKTWFLKRYPKDVVDKDNVFFNEQHPNEFTLYSSKEWLSKHRGL